MMIFTPEGPFALGGSVSVLTGQAGPRWPYNASKDCCSRGVCLGRRPLQVRHGGCRGKYLDGRGMGPFAPTLGGKLERRPVIVDRSSLTT
jgi:hypothetical protein